MAIVKKALPTTDLIWAGSVQWASGSGSPAYAFGPDEATVDTVLQHLQDAVVNMEFQKNYALQVPRLGQSKQPMSRVAEEIFEGIEESIQIRGPSRHQLDEMWFEGAHMPEVLARIETEPHLVIDLPMLSFDDLAPYCKQPEALRPFIIGGESSSISSQQAVNILMANHKESVMTQRYRTPTPRRRNMRRRATAKQIRAEVRERLDRRAEARDNRRPPARRPERRRISAERMEEMQREQRRDQRLATLQTRKAEREEHVRQERLAAMQERREERSTDEARIARLEELRGVRPAATPKPQQQRRVAAAAAPAPPPQRQRRRPPVKAAPIATAPEQPRKQIYVKANNSAGMPEGYYELDPAATQKYQTHLKREAAAKAKPKKTKKKAPSKRKKAAAPVKKGKKAPPTTTTTRRRRSTVAKK